MSVINKMLRDLDKQQQQQNHKGFASFKPQRKSHLLLWAAVPLALLAGWCGQAWYMERFSIKTEQAATATEVQKGQVHPLAAVTQLVPQAQSLAAVTNLSTAQLAEEPITLQDVVATRISPEAAAQLAKKQTAEPAAVTESGLKPFVDQPVAEERVVQVVLAEPVSVASNDPLFANTTATDEVQVTEFDQSGDFSAESETTIEPDWNDTPQVADKPRSLAIEKVQLSPEQQKDLLKNKAQKSETLGKLDQAVGFWQQVRQLDPSGSEAYLELSRLAQLQRNDAAAVQILEQASATGVQDPKLSMALAALALKQQDWTKALTYLQYEPDIFNYTDFYALKAAALQKTNQHAQSVQVFQQLARQQPEQARWWLGMALSYDAMQQSEQALLAYRQVAVNGFGLSPASLDYVKKRIAALE
jgi:MSHA biogenesis protein MshN